MNSAGKPQARGKILDEIMRHHREQLPRIKRVVPLASLQALASVAPEPIDFYAALARPGVTLIAECKKASPSKGLMVRDYEPVALALMYARGGAGAISVLTDGRYFQGSLEHLRDVKEATLTRRIPVLRKDFIFDAYQVYEARAAGADALLLIAAVLSDTQIRDLLALTRQLGMEALVEVHTADELARVLPLGPRIVGINNRNLQTFEVDFGNTARLRALIPPDVLAVGESGLQSADDIRAMREIGVDAVLIGETLVKSHDPQATVRTLVAAGRPTAA